MRRPFVATSARQVERIMQLCSLTSADTLCDLGCGDGGVLRQCARATDCATVGVEVDSALVLVARAALAPDLLSERHVVVEALVGPFCCDDARFDACTVIFLHLVEPQLISLTPALRLALARGARVVTQRWSIPGCGDVLKETLPSAVAADDAYFGTLGEAYLYSAACSTLS